MRGAYSTKEAILERAREAGRNNIRGVLRFKEKWSSWLLVVDTNIPLLISNVFYIAVSLTALILAMLVMNEHVGDFRRNEFTEHYVRDAAGQITSEMQQYSPCGMPTPDSMYLLQAMGALPASGFDGAGLEPNYKTWMQKVDRALCSRIVPGKELPGYDDDIAVCEFGGGYIDYGTDHAEELLALGYLMDDDAITPTLDDIDDQVAITDKKDAFEERACLEKTKKATATNPELDFFYTNQQRNAYGDLKTRVARAYIAAMPAFSRYQKERSTCAEESNKKDPFDSMCKHSCHVRKELKLASEQQVLLYTTADIPAGTTFTKQLYRLLALSLAGYYDRYHNNGACFRNLDVYQATDSIPAGLKAGDALSAYDFCAASMNPTTPGNALTFNNKDAVGEYSKQNHNIEGDEQCTIPTTHPPPPPAPPNYRFEPLEGLDKTLSAQVCAAMLQYGLFEQGRLFGIPDIIHPFVVDNRVDRNLHFIGQWIYDAMYVNPRKKAGDILADPKANLELYIAYRLSSTSIWVILVANVAGYMLVRASAPVFVFALKLFGVRSNVQKIGSTVVGAPKEMEPIVLIRPKYGWPVYLAMFTILLAIYWIFWIDPATQSHYYITPQCDDWAGLGVHVPSGAYVTNWSKRRFSRFGEHAIGILLGISFLLLVLEGVIGKAFVRPGLLRLARRIRAGSTMRLDGIAILMIVLALIIQTLFISQSWVSGNNWYEAIKASDNERELLVTFSKDVLMSVWAALWSSVAISFYRQKWAIDKLPNVFQIAWMVANVLLLWMPVFQSAAYLTDEIDVAFSDGKGTDDTPRLIIYILIYAFSGIWTGVLVLRLKELWDAMPKKVPPMGANPNNPTNVNAKKKMWRDVIAEANRAANEQNTMSEYDLLARAGTAAPSSQPMFNLSGMKVPSATVPVRPQSKDDAVYMPLLPSH